MFLYRVLLYLYPAAFRAEYGEEMCRVVADRLRVASGLFSLLTLWLDVASDTLSNALRAHFDLLRQDLRYTLRSLGRAPGFAATLVVVSALGIGANTAVFTVVDRVLLRPLPFPDSDRLVKLWENVPGYSRLEVSPPNYLDWREMSSSFESMAAFHETSLNLVGRGEPIQLRAASVDAKLFSILATEPLRGRVLEAEDVRENAPDVLVLGYGLWQRVFAGDPDVIGKTVQLDTTGYTIVGILPRDFCFPSRDIELWIPKRFSVGDLEERDNYYLEVLAKLRPGVSIDEARSEMNVIAERLEQEYPEENADTGAGVIYLRDEVPSQSRSLLLALLGASICVLVIACSNIANLLLARAMERRQELTVRTALGGGRDRLVRQLLTESVVLSAIGGSIGLVIALVTVPLLSRLVPARLPIGEASALDPRVLGFAMALTALTAIGFGVLPALRASRARDLSGLRQGSRPGAGARREGLRSVLVVAQVTASVGLLIASGLLIRALWRVESVDPGFRVEGVTAIETPLPVSKYAQTSRRAALYRPVLEDVRTLPGVSEAAYVSALPMVWRGGIWPVEMDGITERPETASLRFVTPRFFATMGIPLELGRDVSDGDTFDAPFVAVVSESFVRRYWPDRDPIGHKFHFAFFERTVVGVVGDILVRGLERPSEPQVYLPYQQVPDGGLVFYSPKELVVRTRTGPKSLTAVTALTASIREIVHRADPELPVADVRTLEAVVDAETAPRATQLRVLGAFAIVSLALSAVGVYGLLSFAVSCRRSEIGLRIALGARSSDVLVMVLREGLLLALGGVALGVGLGYVAGRMMEALLAGVAPADTLTYVVAAAVAMGMTLIGSVFPALQAVGVDPTMAIRAE